MVSPAASGRLGGVEQRQGAWRGLSDAAGRIGPLYRTSCAAHPRSRALCSLGACAARPDPACLIPGASSHPPSAAGWAAGPTPAPHMRPSDAAAPIQWNDRFDGQARKGCDILVQALEREGVDTVFAYPGGAGQLPGRGSGLRRAGVPPASDAPAIGRLPAQQLWGQQPTGRALPPPLAHPPGSRVQAAPAWRFIRP